MTIHTFGDSHSQSGWRELQSTYDIKLNHLGPKLAHTLGRLKTSLINLNDYKISHNDAVVFCFGEIDCRCHIHKHVTSDMTYTSVVKSVVDSYIDAINKIIDHSMTKPILTCVYNVVPPINPKMKAGCLSKDFPFTGSDHERKQYTIYFNSLLKQKCKDHDLVFIDVYNDYTDSQGFLNIELSDNTVHIGDPCHLKKFIDINLL